MIFFKKKLPNYFNKNIHKLYIVIPIIAAILVMIYVYIINNSNPNTALFIAAILGLFMAMSIGANDIANNMGPAVGSNAISLLGAIIIAAIFEASGAIIAGGDVVDTIKGGIIDGNQIQNVTIFINIMLATLLGACSWIGIATFSKAPVSATHSIIGGLIGAGFTAISIDVVNWGKILEIIASWIISPVMGGCFSVIIVFAIRKTIMKKKERGKAAKKWVPFFVSIMGAIFGIYLLQKGLKPILKSNETLNSIINTNFSVITGIIIGILVFFKVKLHHKRKSNFFKNSKKFINQLFNIPLIFAVSLLSFAHGSNDVANAIGPLAAINDAIFSGKVASGGASIPLGIMLIGALGISLGLALFGSRLISTVGTEITKINQHKAFSIALATAITVLIASSLGLPVSSTHIAIGGVFGVGIYKERIKRQKGKEKEYINKGIIKKIVLAWVVTLPCSAIIASIMYLEFQRFL